MSLQTQLMIENAALERELDSLRTELANERARGIHTCHEHCTRDGCVNRRLREEITEQCRIIGMSGEREAVHLAEIERLKREVAASQAMNAKLRDEIQHLEMYMEVEGQWHYFTTTTSSELDALVAQSDDTALRERLAEERERCAQEAESAASDDHKYDIATAIRKLEDI